MIYIINRKKRCYHIMSKGLTGILRPNGEFLKCSYGNHGVIAKKIPVEEEMTCIYFSGKHNRTNSLLYLNDEITIAQLKWIMKNIDSLDENQYNIWKQYISNNKYNIKK